jgi:hypothetical protein
LCIVLYLQAQQEEAQGEAEAEAAATAEEEARRFIQKESAAAGVCMCLGWV